MVLDSPPRLQWSLEIMAGSVLSIGRGLIRAAFSDNLRLLALPVYERYNAHQEELLARKSETRVLGFAEARVKYSGDDSADVMS